MVSPSFFVTVHPPPLIGRIFFPPNHFSLDSGMIICYILGHGNDHGHTGARCYAR